MSVCAKCGCVVTGFIKSIVLISGNEPQVLCSECASPRTYSQTELEAAVQEARREVIEATEEADECMAENERLRQAIGRALKYSLDGVKRTVWAQQLEDALDGVGSHITGNCHIVGCKIIGPHEHTISGPAQQPDEYERGRTQGSREAFNTACKADCYYCGRGSEAFLVGHGYFHNERGQYRACASDGARRAYRAKYGEELEAPKEGE